MANVPEKSEALYYHIPHAVAMRLALSECAE
jgi:hypothetical protein